MFYVVRLVTNLRNPKQFGRVPKTPMSEFVCQYANNFFRLAFLYQGVVDYNMLLPWQTVKVGVAVGASLATVDNIERIQREFQSLGQILNAALERTLFEW